MKTNYKLNNLIRNNNIINCIKAQRLSWFGHVDLMTNDGMFKKLYECKPLSTGLAARPKIRWKNDIKEDLRIMGVNNWAKCIQDRGKRKEVVEKAKLSNSAAVARDEHGTTLLVTHNLMPKFAI